MILLLKNGLTVTNAQGPVHAYFDIGKTLE
jgi:hypothetical protein